MVNGVLEEHFLTVLHIKHTDAREITRTLTTYISDKELQYKKLVGQWCDGASAFSGVHSGVQKRMRVHAAHALYIYCSCLRLQLASIQAAESIPIMFFTMGS